MLWGRSAFDTRSSDRRHPAANDQLRLHLYDPANQAG